jgi:hypothetical protein
VKVVVITGSRRGWKRPDEVRVTLRDADVLIVGDAVGVDAIATREAQALKVYVNKFYADWDSYGSSAGPLRNQKMVDRAVRFRDSDGASVTCHAFPAQDSRGTHDCRRRLLDAGFNVEVHEP